MYLCAEAGAWSKVEDGGEGRGRTDSDGACADLCACRSALSRRSRISWATTTSHPSTTTDGRVSQYGGSSAGITLCERCDTHHSPNGSCSAQASHAVCPPFRISCGKRLLVLRFCTPQQRFDNAAARQRRPTARGRAKTARYRIAYLVNTIQKISLCIVYQYVRFLKLCSFPHFSL